MTRLLIIACSKTKKPYSGRAIDVYDGPSFRILRKYLSFHDDVDVVIVSSKYGIISSETKIEPYDEYLSEQQIHEFRQRYEPFIREICSRYEDIFYMKFMTATYDIIPKDIKIREPAKGPIGIKLKSFSEWLKEGDITSEADVYWT